MIKAGDFIRFCGRHDQPCVVWTGTDLNIQKRIGQVAGAADGLELIHSILLNFGLSPKFEGAYDCHGLRLETVSNIWSNHFFGRAEQIPQEGYLSEFDQVAERRFIVQDELPQTAITDADSLLEGEEVIIHGERWLALGGLIIGKLVTKEARTLVKITGKNKGEEIPLYRGIPRSFDRIVSE